MIVIRGEMNRRRDSRFLDALAYKTFRLPLGQVCLISREGNPKLQDLRTRGARRRRLLIWLRRCNSNLARSHLARFTVAREGRCGSVGAGTKTTEGRPTFGTEPVSGPPRDGPASQRRVKSQGSNIESVQQVAENYSLCDLIIIATLYLSFHFSGPLFRDEKFREDKKTRGSICGDAPRGRSTSPDLPRIGE